MRLELHAGKLARAVLRGEGGGNTDLLTRHRADDDESGRPGSPSFYVVHDRRFGWSWRCLSTNCAQSSGPMRHSFRLWQELLGLSAAGALAEAAQRWPQADPARGSANYEPQASERRGPDGVHDGG